VFFQEQRAALTEEHFPHAVGDGDQRLLGAAEDGRDIVHAAGRLPVEAAAGMHAAVLEHARTAGLLFLLRMGARFARPTLLPWRPGLCAMVLYRDRAHRFEAFCQDAPYRSDPAAPGMAEFDSAVRTIAWKAAARSA
jgi:hypothetical protein